MSDNLTRGLYLTVGIIGVFITLYGITQPSSNLYYLTGTIFMLATAIYFQFTYYVALDIILIAGQGAILLGIGPFSQVILPILLCLQLLIYYLLIGQFKNIFRLIGIAGIALLSIAFANQNQLDLLLGSMGVVVFSFYQVYRGRPIAILWGILYFIFAIISAYEIFLI